MLKRAVTTDMEDIHFGACRTQSAVHSVGEKDQQQI